MLREAVAMLQGTIQCPIPSTRKQSVIDGALWNNVNIQRLQKTQAAKEIIEAYVQLKKIGNDFL